MGEIVMRIGIDIKCLRYNKGGIGRYLRCMLEALQNEDSTNEYILYSPQPMEYKTTSSNFKCKVVKPPFKMPGFLWQQFVLPQKLKADKIDVFWGPEQTIPIWGFSKNMAKVVTIHDMVYKRFPETMQRSVLWISRYISNRSIKIADSIFCVSKFTQSELLQFFPKLDAAKVHVKYEGSQFASAVVKKFQPRQKQLLFVGSLEPRKNLTTLIKALEILHEKGEDISLKLTGPQGWKNENFKTKLSCSPVKQNVSHLGYVTDEELARLYSDSAAVVFPSLYEGFGLPVLESFAHNTPVLTSRNSVMEEIAGPCALYFDPYDAESIASCIHDFFAGKFDFEGTSKLREKIVQTYTWKAAAQSAIEGFIEAYQQIHEEAP